ncbi:riboflavin biosynthesis protein RibF [Paraprevotella xylaniphila]|uniref:riboflavin biosynthesis protein RibF n=1 Tax=Paraprevotella xylaniphila TaxID=454155 RepID=UPI0039F47689
MKFITLTDPLPYQACVATIGFFDGVHRGHRFLIRQLTRYAVGHDLASLLVTFRTHPRQVMQAAYQPQLLTTYDEKCGQLATTGADYCLTLDFTTALAALSARRFMAEILKEKLSVKVLVIGYDHRFGHDRSEGFAEYVEYGRELGMEVVRADAFAMSEVNVSSSMVRACLAEGEVGIAARCLTRPYEITGRVVHGFHVGHELGFPTANIQVEDSQKLIPKNGVYAVWVKGKIGGEEHVWGGMLNIGLRPTVENGENRTIEVHLLDFAGDLYGCRLTLSFVRRLRDERKFRNKGELVHQLREDEAMVRMILNKEQ